MSRITNSDISAVGKVAKSVDFFVPTDTQKKLKVMFWSKWKMGPSRSGDEITAAAVVHLTGVSTVEAWWSEPLFRDWFTNENHMSEEVDYNAILAVETLRQLMFSENDNIKLKAATESLKAKNEMDKAAERKESEEGTLDPANLQRLLNSALRAGIISLPEADNGG